MAIEFDKEKKSKQIQEIDNKTETKKEKKQKEKKTPLNTSLNVFLGLAIVAALYVVSYCATGVITLMPTAIMWILWFTLVMLASVATAGIIWISEGWRSFNSSFMGLNKKLSSASLEITQFLYRIFPYVAAAFGAIVLTCLILAIVSKVKDKENKYHSTSKLVWSIILTVLYVVFIVLDIVVFIK